MSAELTSVKQLFRRLERAPLHLFPRKGSPRAAPERQGVYIILSPTLVVLHVGRTTRARRGLFQRVNNHLLNGSSFAIKYLKRGGRRLRGRYYFRYLEVRSPRKRALLEAYAVGMLGPKHLGLGAGTA